jgi:mannose-6-phosphate isomerase-like protein (cupin superfamily)
LRYRDDKEAKLKPGDFHVVPRGVEHFPYAPEEAWIIFIEPTSTTHTGDTESELARPIEEQIAHLR